MPPAACNALRCTSMQPPAAAAVAFPGRLTHANGYSIRKKKMKAGISARSAKLSQCSFAISDVEHQSVPARARDERGQRFRRIADVRVGEQHVVGRLRQRRDMLRPAVHCPQLAGPRCRKLGRGQVPSGARAMPAVAAAGGRGRRCRRAVVVDHDDIERARIVLPQQRRDGRGNDVGLVAGRHDGDDARPGRAAQTSRRPPRRRVRPARQNPPRSSSANVQAAHASASNAPACRHFRWPAPRNHATASCSPSPYGRAS